MVYNETGLEGFNMSFEMLSDLGIKKYEMCRDDIGRFFARSVAVSYTHLKYYYAVKY